MRKGGIGSTEQQQAGRQVVEKEKRLGEGEKGRRGKKKRSEEVKRGRQQHQALKILSLSLDRSCGSPKVLGPT